MIHVIVAAMICMPVAQPFVGTVCSPNDGKQHPAVILLGGSEGGDSMKKIAGSFSERGYVAASVAYFKAPGLPQTLVNVPVETVETAIDSVSRRADVRPGGVGIFGGSRGGELAMLVATLDTHVKAVVGVVPSPYAYMGLGQYNMATGCAWTVKSTLLPCIPADQAAGEKIGEQFKNHEPITLVKLFDASREKDPSVTERATLHLENIHGPVLCLAAEDDQVWNSGEHCDFTAQYLKAHHHAYPDETVVYPHAGHTFITATAGPASAVTQLSIDGVTMAFGGTSQGDQDAAKAAWSRIWAFFGATLQP